MLLEGPALLLNPNAVGARKQLLSCRHWQGERPQMDFNSKPLSLPGPLITHGLDPRPTEDPRARKIGNRCLRVMSQAGSRPNAGSDVTNSELPESTEITLAVCKGPMSTLLDSG
ncbi:uncharacterized protein LOC118991342 [Sturnira hondurensis]|uniref:uncharacterized protein LOC118991342 n=1 Tax=Sturnira hondurensis TaxID=192404 RepID=UPI00187ACA72|nr:uncharacterized protein LOC118991342 [Sturnira hondurensis]